MPEKPFRDRCEGIAVDLRDEMGLKAYDRLLANQLAAHLKAIIQNPAELETSLPQQLELLLSKNNWSACVVTFNPVVIWYNPRHSANRYESSIMHELAHIILKHSTITFDPLTMMPLRDPQHEKEAEYLGGCLQIPRRGLLWAFQQDWGVSQIATHFGASVEMVRYRCNVQGLKPK